MAIRTESVEEMRSQIEYQPKTGKLFWKNTTQNDIWGRSGKEAFTDVHRGYKSGSFKGKTFLAHRVAFAVYYGFWPNEEIDHINGTRDDNRIENLREVTRQENAKNRRRTSRNESGIVGVGWYPYTKKWRAHIKENGRQLSLGHFPCIGMAIAARRKAEKRLGFHPNHGKAPNPPA
jgi:hypothetical protein